MVKYPAMIRTDDSNAFAHDTMKRRIPANIREVAALNADYPPFILQALNRLATAIENDEPIAPFNPFLPDADPWEAGAAAHEGHTWQQTDWFFAELAAYRHLIDTVRWWETGRDPFAPQKAKEMGSEELWGTLSKALTVAAEENTLEQRLQDLIRLDLWGNRIDLSFAASLAHGSAGSHEDILVDDSAVVAEHLMRQNGAVHFVADNTGTELAMDLVLADSILIKGHPVTFHLKLHPTFVSDTIVVDFHIMLAAMQSGEHGQATTELGQRLQTAFDEGRLRLAPGAFWNSPYVMSEMPKRLAAAFKDAALVIVKGDLNYRRLVSDTLWESDTPFTEICGYFPAPLLALRTLKSDAVVGLASGLAAQLDTEDAKWRVNGKRGVIQFKV
ncbi:MAG: protein-glutamate O-methyltransferase family protein [Chloroflexi bacterium]|nr:protein-glutamate O-methyltransferase family protein [Chloroflexota bacterium]MCC6894673.1 protein-glutamate O-methyltransferase family protein [Anaerolineae bacterium]